MQAYTKGKESYSRKELSQAKEYFLNAAKLDKKFLNARLMLAKIYYYEQNFKAALSQVNGILTINEDHIGALYWKARILIVNPESKNIDRETTDCLLRVLELDSHHILARSLLALLYEKNENYKEALYEYHGILQEEESIIDARANLSILYKRLGLKSKAMDEISAALSIAKAGGFDDARLISLKKEIEQ